MSDCRIYVACLASYNSGKIHGTWIDDCTDEDVMAEEIATMLRESPCPNVLVDCPDCSGKLSRFPSLDTVGFHPETDMTTCATCKGTGKVPSAEEWAIHDHEGFDGIKLGEHASLADVAKHAAMIEEHDGAWSAYVGNVVGEHYATEDDFSDTYQGQHDSAEAFAEQMHDDCGTDLGTLASYIDWERVARDLGFDGYAFVPDGSGGVYVFSPS